jgi:hypothetical protein
MTLPWCHTAPRPSKGWPDFDACLDRNLFPAHILTDALLEKTLVDLIYSHSVLEHVDDVAGAYRSCFAC